jgi:DNA-binding Lrp family transcriptional regulator
MDNTDKKLIALLQENARKSTSELARHLGLSRTTVQDRINRLEERKVISGYTVKFDPAYNRRMLTAHVMVKIEPRGQDAVVSHCRKMPEVTGLHTISGEFDLIAIVKAETPEGLDKALDDIRRIKGIERTTTSIVLTTKMER